MLNPINKTIELGDGRTITIETGKLAKQADGAVTVRMNNTVLLATVCAAKDANPGVDFMPLQVEYKEKYSAFGRFPGGFTKREGKASDYEILTSRLVDRALRVLSLFLISVIWNSSFSNFFKISSISSFEWIVIFFFSVP